MNCSKEEFFLMLKRWKNFCLYRRKQFGGNPCLYLVPVRSLKARSDVPGRGTIWTKRETVLLLSLCALSLKPPAKFFIFCSQLSHCLE
jgi:hypothetical protein